MVVMRKAFRPRVGFVGFISKDVCLCKMNVTNAVTGQQDQNLDKKQRGLHHCDILKKLVEHGQIQQTVSRFQDPTQRGSSTTLHQIIVNKYVNPALYLFIVMNRLSYDTQIITESVLLLLWASYGELS